jgi:hypothetical protein
MIQKVKIKGNLILGEHIKVKKSDESSKLVLESKKNLMLFLVREGGIK